MARAKTRNLRDLREEKVPKVPKEKITYPAGEYVCHQDCYSGAKFYYRGDVKIVSKETKDTNLKHFTLKPKQEMPPANMLD